ncbi:MAG: putative Ig domain-containing protein [Hormoscilla sp. GM7CHS1pb]|nr:putative Ig domain-containing protein [Hormoscilla sp. GM7CHS1pb]
MVKQAKLERRQRHPPDADVVATWHGITVEDSRVTEIKLDDNNLVGNIPPELGGLDQLRNLSLTNNSLTGTIPSELGELSNLTKLRLHNNEITGTIPTELGELANLQILGLSANALTGTIPPELGNLTSLQNLYLWQNELTGAIPPELGNLTGLRNLWLQGNHLTGDLPASVEALSATKRLENPPYVGVPIEDVDAVVEYDRNSTRNHNLSIDISGNFGDINDNITSYSVSGLPNGLTFDPITGVISGTPARPTAVIDPRNSATSDNGNFLVTVTASDDAGGSVTDKFNISVSFKSSSAGLYLINASDYGVLKDINNGHWNLSTDREHMPVSDEEHGSVPLASAVNGLDGVTAEKSRVTELTAGVSRALPSELSKLTGLQKIELDRSGLSGNIPPELGDLDNLTHLWLDHNSLTGNIPPELGNLRNLTWLKLNKNSLSGSIPPELGNLSNLQELWMGNNSLSGSIPPELGNATELQNIYLDHNNLTGTIPSSLENLSNLTKLWLQNNSLEGPVPPGLNDINDFNVQGNPLI